MAIGIQSSQLQNINADAFRSGLDNVTTSIIQQGLVDADAIEAFSTPSVSISPELAGAASFPDPGTAFVDDTQLSKFLLDPQFDISSSIREFSPFLSSTADFTDAISNTIGFAEASSPTGEQAVSDAIIGLTTSIDDLMKEASTLDLSTAEGQARLAEIQLEFAQKSRLLEALSQMIAKFQELISNVISNIGR